MTESRQSENAIQWVGGYFLVAYLMAGDPAEAVASLEEAINNRQTAKDDEQDFLMLVAQSACRLGRNPCAQPRPRSSGLQVDLPRELQNVLGLPTLQRRCFLLHLCERMPTPMCARILDLTVEDVDQNIRSAVIELARAHSPVGTP